MHILFYMYVYMHGYMYMGAYTHIYIYMQTLKLEVRCLSFHFIRSRMSYWSFLYLLGSLLHTLELDKSVQSGYPACSRKGGRCPCLHLCLLTAEILNSCQACLTLCGSWEFVLQSSNLLKKCFIHQVTFCTQVNPCYITSSVLYFFIPASLTNTRVTH